MVTISRSSSLQIRQSLSFRRFHHWKHCNVNLFEEIIIENTAMLIFSKNSSLKILQCYPFRRVQHWKHRNCNVNLFEELNHWKHCNVNNFEELKTLQYQSFRKVHHSKHGDVILFEDFIIENTKMLTFSKSSLLKTL